MNFRFLPMLRRFALFGLLAAGACELASAQDFDHYTPLKCANPVPEELRTSSSSKYNADIAKLGKGDEADAKKEFLLQSNFQLDEMLLSGKVLFNDPVSAYCTQVKDKILASEPELQKKVRIYVVKSPVVNAYATNSGTLLVNLGLIAHLHNEAELAFVLCHEIQHYIRKHPIQGYVNTEKLKKNVRSMGLKNSDGLLAERSRYSREQEQEADKLGFELYQKSGYALADAAGVFDVLGTSHLPFDLMPWTFDFFEFDYLRFPESYHRAKLDSIDHHEDEADSASTHPNIGKRRQALMAQIAQAGPDRGETFLVSPATFLAVRKQCRFELCELFMAGHLYEWSLYTAYLLQAEEPESPYLRKVIAQSIYGLASHKNSAEFLAIHSEAEDGEGEFQQLLHFTEEAPEELFSMLAVRQCWKAYLADTTDKELKAIADDVLYQFLDNHADAANWIVREVPATMPGAIDSILKIRQLAPQTVDSVAVAAEDQANAQPEDKEIAQTGAKKKTKAEKEKEQAEKEKAQAEAWARRSAKTSQPVASDDENDGPKRQLAWSRWALCDLFKEDKFVASWEKARKTVKPEDEGTTDWARGRSYNWIDGEHLGIDKVVMLQPTYRSYDFYKKVPVRYLDAEKGLVEFRQTMEEVAKLNHLELKFLESRGLKASDAETMNDMATMMQWVGESMSAQNRVEMINFKQDDAEALIKKYGTPYFGWTGLITLRDHLDAEDKEPYYLAGLILWPLLPIAILSAQLPHNKTYCMSLVFDARSGKTLLETVREIPKKDRNRYIKTTLYDFFYQIKSKPKKTKKK